MWDPMDDMEELMSFLATTALHRLEDGELLTPEELYEILLDGEEDEPGEE